MPDTIVNEYPAVETSRSGAEFLCVDLDGTVLQGDLLWESLLALLGKHPWYFFLVPFWLVRGRAALKREIARRVQWNVSTLPLRQDVVAYLREEKARGRKLILATGSDEMLAARVADSLNLFDYVLGSDGKTNLTGENKRRRIKEVLGERGFDYAGNSSADLPIWEAAQAAILVGASPRLLHLVKKTQTVSGVFDEQKWRWSSVVEALRPLHWTKNLLVFVPLVMAHEIANREKLDAALIAFASFSLCASAVYLLNDLLDLEADRLHPLKRARPFASGALPIWAGLLLSPLLFAGGLAVAAGLSWLFFATMAIYAAATTIYSTYAKREPIVDVLLLTGLYLLRILGGGVATEIPVSPWLLAFSMFFLLSQAFTKRHAELLGSPATENGPATPTKRNYLSRDTDLVRQFGVTSGYLSVLILALYINGREVTSLYRRPEIIWLACPLLLFWISRLWFLTNRGQMHEDPVVFATRDPVSYLVGLIMLLILFAAS